MKNFKRNIFLVMLLCTSAAQSLSKDVENTDKETTLGSDDYDEANQETTEPTDTKPPLLFPDEPGNSNQTALEILQNSTNNTKNTTSAIETFSETTKNIDASSTTTASRTTENDYESVNEQDVKSDVEDFQPEKKEPPSELEEQFGNNNNNNDGVVVFEESKIRSGHIAFIFASILVFLSITAYVGLVVWRNRLESRYGMRQRLVTEDDYYNNNDIRFFGL